MKPNALHLAMAASLANMLPTVTLAVPSTNCPAAVSNTITVAAGTTVVATQTNGCTLGAGESIVVESNGAIDFDQASFFGDNGVAGIAVASGEAAGSVNIQGTVAVGDNNSRAGVRIPEGSSLVGALDVSGSIAVTGGGSSTFAIYASGDIGGDVTVSGTLNSQRGAIEFSGVAATQGISISVTETGELRAQAEAVRLFGAFGGTTSMPNFTNAGYIGSQEGGSGGLVGGGVALLGDKQITSFSNTGTIEARRSANDVAGYSGVSLVWDSSITTLNNTGTISGIDGGDGILVGQRYGGITTLNNNAGGVISAVNQGAGVRTQALIGTLNNNGTLSGAVTGLTVADYQFYGYDYVSGRIDTLVNLGTITGGAFDIETPTGRLPTDPQPIGTFKNLQSRLTYKGMLPENYEIAITDANTYGSLIFTQASGLMTFKVADDANLQQIIYPDVLDGVSEDQLSALTGTAGSLSWALLNNGGNEYDLCVGIACPGAEGEAVPVPVPVIGPWLAGIMASLMGLLGLLGIRRRWALDKGRTS